MAIPLLADFAVRTGCGLAVFLLTISLRQVPPAFFRTQCQIILGLLVLAALDVSRAGPVGTGVYVVGGTAALAYVASIAWGLGLPRAGLPLTVLIAAASGAVLVSASRSSADLVGVVNAAGRVSSALLIGSTLTAMLLGHYYLTAPAMSIDPLRRLVRAMGWTLGARSVLAALGLWLWLGGHVSVGFSPTSTLFLAIRWGMGIAGPALATFLTWKTVQIRSTQSATGILYIAFTLVLFGELSTLILGRDLGLVF